MNQFKDNYIKKNKQKEIITDKSWHRNPIEINQAINKTYVFNFACDVYVFRQLLRLFHYVLNLTYFGSKLLVSCLLLDHVWHK